MVGIVDLDFGLQSVSLEIGFANDTGDGALKLGIGQEVGDQGDLLSNDELSSFVEGDVDAGL